MKRFVPKEALFEPEATDYRLGQKIKTNLQQLGVPLRTTPSHNRVTGLKGKTPLEKYVVAKQTLVVGVRRSLDFAPCKPSAHYQLPLVTSCPGLCEYCYLQTTLGPRPVIRVYVNLEEILDKAKYYIEKGAPETIIFEGAAVSDPVPVEHITGALQETIQFFGHQPRGRFRFVTKFDDIDSLLQIEHNHHTEARFSLNTDYVISEFEKGTATMEQRIEAAKKMALAHYPTGFLIAPIITYENWKDEYENMLELLADKLPTDFETTFELITHRFTPRAKTSVLEKHPNSKLPMEESTRQFKFGQFGYGKYVYKKEEMGEIEDFFRRLLGRLFPKAVVSYFV